MAPYPDKADLALRESETRVLQERMIVIDARRLASVEQQALEAGRRLPTFWARYNELRRECGLAEVAPPAQ